MGRWERPFRSSIESAGLGLVLGGATFLLARLSGEPNLKLEVLGGLLGSLLGTILWMLVLRNRELANLEQSASERAAEGDTIHQRLAQNLKQGHQLPRVIQNVTLCGLEAAVNSVLVKVEDKAVHVEGRVLALKCYARFWDHIIELQNRSELPLIVRVTHSSEIDIFYDRDARKLKSLHSLFTKQGYLFRMLIDREAQTPQRVERYLKAIGNMHGIHCVYINVFDNPFLLEDNEHMEFCIVDGSVNYCSEWRMENSNQVQAYSLSQAPKRYRESMEDWDSVLGHIREYDYADDDVREDQRQKLRELKESFLTEYDKAVAGAPIVARPAFSLDNLD